MGKLFFRYREVKNELRDLRKNMNKLQETLDRTQRIIDNAKEGKITYKLPKNYINSLTFFCTDVFTYIYKDNKEYRIDGLWLENPTFINNSDKELVIYVKDIVNNNCIYNYTVDLFNGTFINTSITEIK